jgi:hypothetical protein
MVILARNHIEKNRGYIDKKLELFEEMKTILKISIEIVQQRPPTSRQPSLEPGFQFYRNL